MFLEHRDLRIDGPVRSMSSSAPTAATTDVPTSTARSDRGQVTSRAPSSARTTQARATPGTGPPHTTGRTSTPVLGATFFEDPRATFREDEMAP
ncbi:MAG: hypothetical protein EA387_12730 [Nitriliruptor sp.]|nr:MAG: hypothetical protein EA387_12730 [Nitriliruptor sp.]